VHRSRHPKQKAEGPARPRADHPAKLSVEEAHEVIETLNSRRFMDKAPAQAWAVLLDEGTYLCSISTMYRLLRAEGLTGERRRQATHPSRVRPELVADGPDQIWSWDITKLKGPVKGVTYDLHAPRSQAHLYFRALHALEIPCCLHLCFLLIMSGIVGFDRYVTPLRGTGGNRDADSERGSDR
jgi:hypothetical protein